MNKMTNKFKEETRAQIIERRKKEGDRFSEFVFRSAKLTAGFKKSPKMQEYLDYLINEFGVLGFIPACSVPARILLMEHQAKLMVRMFREVFEPKGIDLYHMTLAMPDDATGDQETKINWKRGKARVFTVMKYISKDFIGMGEVDITINEKCEGNGKGRDIMPHFHVIFWTDKLIHPRKLSEQLSKRYPNHRDGMKVVNIARCRPSELDIVKMVTYPYKVPQGGKTKWFHKMFDGSGALDKVTISRSTHEKAHRPIITSRIAEILSHTDFRQLMISGGQGVPLKNKMFKILNEITDLHAINPPDNFSYEKTLSFWEKMRSTGWGKRYSEPEITL